MRYYRRCPSCNVELSYSQQSSVNQANRNNSDCLSCSKKETTPWNVGIKNGKYITCSATDCDNSFYIEPRELNNTGDRFCSKSCSVRGENNPVCKAIKRGDYNAVGMRGKTHSTETLLKMRVSTLRGLEEKHGKLYPNYNSSACKVIDEYGDSHGYKFQHAENGGEFHIKELGYWVDGYDLEKNVVIEYYEPFHERQAKHDMQRKQEIVNLLGCEFIEIRERI